MSTTSESSEPAKSSDIGAVLSRLFQRRGILLIAALLFVALALTQPTFLSSNNIKTLFYGVSLEIYVMIGFTLLLIMGEVDLSVGSVFAFAGMIVGYMGFQGVPMAIAVPAGILVGALIGLINGLLVVRLRINSIILTIGTLIAVRGLADVFATLMAGRRFVAPMRSFSKGIVFDLVWTIPTMVVVVLVAEFLLRRSAAAQRLFYIGQNKQSAELYGLNVDWVRIGGFTLSGALAALSGILVASRITNPDVNLGVQLEFSLLTAAVLGGASLFGGRGSILNSAVALLFLAMILNALILLKVDPVLQQLIIGALLIAVVIIDTRLHANRG